MDDATRSYRQGDLIGTGINLLGVIPGVGKVASDAAKAGRSTLREIYHGTSPEAARAIDQFGFDLGKTADGSAWFTENPNIGEVAATGQGAVVKRQIDDSNLKLASYEETDKYTNSQLMDMGYDGAYYPGQEGGTQYEIWNQDKLNEMSPLSGLTDNMEETAPRDLYFMHNTTPQALERYNALGGLPAPSVAVTREDIPFENFGEITLIGRPDRFAPEADKANTMYSGDAYTIRAPDAFRMPMEDAPDRVRADYEPFESQEEYSVMDAEVGANYLERMLKQTNPSQDSRLFDDIFHSEAGLKKFAADNNIAIDPDRHIRRVRDENYDLFNSWVEKEKDKYFTPELYFDAASKNASKGKIKPFTNENIIPYMRKNKGAGTEETSTVGIGKIRASVQPEIKSLDQAREKKQMLQDFDSDEVGTKEIFENKLLDLHDALEPYYKWPGAWQMRNDVGTALSNAPKIGIRAALEREGFENVPESLIPELDNFVSELANAPTGYFESKPMRQVGFDEFSGAIVPSYAPESTLRLLESKGIPYEIYDDPTKGAFLGNQARLEARKKFRDSAFMLGGLGVGGAAYLNQEQQPGI
jgi:hypothetical protein